MKHIAHPESPDNKSNGKRGARSTRKRGDNPVSDSRKRKRGAPLGNRNAFKHGFYSDQFKRAERRALNGTTLADLTEEIKLLRIQMHRCFEAENRAAGEIDYELRLSTMRAFSQACDSLTRLVRLQTFTNIQSEDWKKIEDILNDESLDDFDGDD